MLTLSFKLELQYVDPSSPGKEEIWRSEFVPVSSQGTGGTLQAKIVYEIVDMASVIFVLKWGCRSCFVLSQYLLVFQDKIF